MSTDNENIGNGNGENGENVNGNANGENVNTAPETILLDAEYKPDDGKSAPGGPVTFFLAVLSVLSAWERQAIIKLAELWTGERARAKNKEGGWSFPAWAEEVNGKTFTLDELAALFNKSLPVSKRTPEAILAACRTKVTAEFAATIAVLPETAREEFVSKLAAELAKSEIDTLERRKAAAEKAAKKKAEEKAKPAGSGKPAGSNKRK